MDKILKDFNYSQQQNDLFSYWDDELLLRRKIRNLTPSKNVKLRSVEDYLFIKRAFYFTDKSFFFSLLFENLHNMFLIDLLIQSPAFFLREFLEFLPAYIQKNDPDNQKLKFIIHLYQDEWQEYFIEICNHLDAKKCRFLIERTASPGLLSILQKRLDSLKELAGPTSLKYNPTDTLYGDKKQLIRQGLNILSTIKTDPTDDKYIELCELFFKIGLIEECLLLIKHKSSQYRPSESETGRTENPKKFNRFIHKANRLLYKTLPLYALLYHPDDSYNYARDMYQSFFPEFTPDSASLLYLDLYNTAAANPRSLKNYSFFELVTRIRKIKYFRPGDELFFWLEQFINLKNTSILKKMFAIARQRIYSLPHEGYIILEIIRFMLMDINLIIPDKWANTLVNSYLQLFYWIPSSLFLNQAIANQLSVRDKKKRSEIEHILNLQNNFSLQQLRNRLAVNSSHCDLPEQEIPQEFLLGTFLGVL